MAVQSTAVTALARVRSRDARAAAAAAGIIIAGVAALRLGFGPFEFRQGLLALLCGWTVGAVGLLVWFRAPGIPVGVLLIAVAGTWAIANLERTPFTFVNEVAAPLGLLYAAVMGHAVSAFPHARRSRAVSVTVAAAYAAALLPMPGGGLAVSAILLLLAGTLTSETVRTRSPSLSPAMICAAFGLTLGGTTCVRWFWVGGFALDTRPAIELALIAAAGWLAIATLRNADARLRVTDLVIELGQNRGGGLARQLAAAIRDPTLEVGYALGDGRRYVDATGRPVTLPEADSVRAVTAIERNGRRVAVLVHDRSTATDAGVRSAIARAVELSGANARLQASVQRQADEVAASRRRLLEAADDERKHVRARLDQDLGPRLDALEAALELDVMSPTLEQLHEIRTEVDAIADGLYPHSLDERGLAGAIEQLAFRSAAIPVTLAVPADVRAAPAAAATLYFVCSEALANAEKHSGAAAVRVTLETSGAVLTMQVEDDGTGGADPSRGTGLAGLRERVAALGGSLSVTDLADHGTRVTAYVPAFPD